MTNKFENLSKEQVEKAERALKMQEARRAVKQLSDSDAEWDLTQEILQEILATHTIANPDVQPKTPQLITELKQEIERRYEGDQETIDILLNGVPSARSIREWIKKDNWQEAVWKKISGTGLFTHENRTNMIKSLYDRGMTKSDQAAKMWLTMSGDYSDKLDVNDKDSTLERFREINRVLHKTKE